MFAFEGFQHWYPQVVRFMRTIISMLEPQLHFREILAETVCFRKWDFMHVECRFCSAAIKLSDYRIDTVKIWTKLMKFTVVIFNRKIRETKHDLIIKLIIRMDEKSRNESIKSN